MWSATDGYPSEDFLCAVNPKFARVVTDKMPGRLLAPGVTAGGLTAAMATKFGLHEGTPVSAAIIDAHAGVPGAGAAEPGTLVMVMGTSSCHMLNSEVERSVPGIAGVVKDGILPGFFGYETGQAAVGDAFDWLRKLTGQRDFSALAREAAALPPGAEGVRCVDWFNGCRTPLMDGSLTGAFTGLALHHRPAHLYRALLEASAFGLRWIVERLREGGVPVRKFVATGGLPHHNPARRAGLCRRAGRTCHRAADQARPRARRRDPRCARGRCVCVARRRHPLDGGAERRACFQTQSHAPCRL